jgi:very-short-patch-repair endonuclease
MNTCAGIARRARRRPTWALWTALELQAIELPEEFARPETRSEMTHDACIVVNRPHQRYKAKNIRFVQWKPPIAVSDVINTFECTSPACTWAMLSSHVSLESLIVLGEAMMRRDTYLRRATLAEFTAYLDTVEQWARDNNCHNFKGAHKCRQALRLMCENTDSPQETRTRLALIRNGLDRPTINHPLQITGRNLYLDMAYPQFKVGIEYDGEFHSFQWSDDVQRRRHIADAGWQYVQVTSADLIDEAHQQRMVRRVVRCIERETGRHIRLKKPIDLKQLGDWRHWRRKPLFEGLGS